MTLAALFEAELEWLRQIIYFRASDTKADIRQVTLLAMPPLPETIDSNYKKFIIENQLGYDERLLLILSLAPLIQPAFLQKELMLWTKSFGNTPVEINPNWGFLYSEHYKGILPSAFLFVYLLAGNHFANRLEITQSLLAGNYQVLKNEIIYLSAAKTVEPILNGYLYPNPKFLATLLS